MPLLKAKLLKLITPGLWVTALVLVAWTLSQMPMADMWQRVAGLSASQWLLWAGVNLLLIILSTWRWQVLCLMTGQRPGFWRLLMIRQAGQSISFITPGPQFGGEPFQIYWLIRHCRITLQKAMLCLGIDRFYELWINFLMLAAGISFLLLATDLLQAGVNADLWLVLILLLLLLVFSGTAVWWLAANPAWLTQRVQKLSQRWMPGPELISGTDHSEPAADESDAAGKQSRPASTAGTLVLALILSLAGWWVIAAEMWLVLGFFNLYPDVMSVILVLVAMRLALLLPLPGGIGTLEASVFWSSQLLGWPAGATLAVIALMRLRDVLVLLAGLACAAQNRLR